MNRHVLAALAVCGACTTRPVPQADEHSAPPTTGEAVGDTSTSGPSSSGGVGSSSSSSSSSSGFASTDETSGEPTACRGLHPGTSVTIDGTLERGEWSDLQAFEISPSRGWTVPVALKHDGRSLLFAFASLQPGTPPPFAFPEVLLDVGNDKARALGRDDWWFHVSGTDCAATGRIDDYDGCMPEGVGWRANNFPQGTLIDIVEIAIDFDTLGVDPSVEQDIGFLLRLSDTGRFAAHWPADADPEAPSTWSTLHLCP